MLFGAKERFAIECYHEPNFPNGHGWVFGRMCVWCQGVQLGKLHEPDCMLNVTEAHFQDCLARLDNLRDESVDQLPDGEAFQLLDSVLWGDEVRDSGQILADARRYFKFDFLTGWGESFDNTKAFLLQISQEYRILYCLNGDTLGICRAMRGPLEESLQAFLKWITVEKGRVPTA